MTAEPIVQKMEQLRTIHLELTHLSKEKTAAIKKADLKPFTLLVSKEKKLIGTIEQLEEERKALVHAYLGRADGSLADCIHHAQANEGSLLAEKGKQLIECVGEIRQINELNRQLIEQSLQYVNLTISLLVPEEDPYTYERPDQGQERMNRQSMFDSKA